MCGRGHWLLGAVQVGVYEDHVREDVLKSPSINLHLELYSWMCLTD